MIKYSFRNSCVLLPSCLLLCKRIYWYYNNVYLATCTISLIIIFFNSLLMFQYFSKTLISNCSNRCAFNLQGTTENRESWDIWFHSRPCENRKSMGSAWLDTWNVIVLCFLLAFRILFGSFHSLPARLNKENKIFDMIRYTLTRLQYIVRNVKNMLHGISCTSTWSCWVGNLWLYDFLKYFLIHFMPWRFIYFVFNLMQIRTYISYDRVSMKLIRRGVLL